MQRCSLGEDDGNPAVCPRGQVPALGWWSGELGVLVVGERTETAKVGSDSIGPSYANGGGG